MLNRLGLLLLSILSQVSQLTLSNCLNLSSIFDFILYLAYSEDSLGGKTDCRLKNHKWSQFFLTADR
jgi:hypothetical protein